MNNNVHMDNLLDLAKCGKLPHAILLEGESLEYSFEFAKKTVKTLFCENNLTPNKNVEVIKDKIQKNIHPDVFILECEGKAKTIGVSQIRRAKETLYIKPNESFYKVYIVKDAQTLTVQSQNALLKILEEPPCYAIFILICKSANTLLDTIVSRVQRFFVDNNCRENSDVKAIEDETKKLIESFLLKKEITIMEATSDLLKNKKSFRDVMEFSICVFYSAVLNKCCDENEKGDISEICKKISVNMSKDKIIRFIDLFKYICFLIDSNVNTNLIVSYFSLKIMELVIL